MTASSLTRASLRLTPSTLLSHTRLDNGGSIHQWRCDRHPRLVKQIYRGHRSAPAITTWMVDGVPCADLDEAIRLLNGPPIAEDIFEATTS